MRLHCLVLLGLLLSCSRTPTAKPQAKQKVAAAPPSTVLRYGGDARAWVGPLGNIQDQSYCHARLKLPLAAKPQWEYAYTSAEFSGVWPTSILNYNGTLVVCAQSPQLMLMDAASGKVLQNKDLYQRNDGFSPQEAFYGTYLSPAGRLVAVDGTDALYCFDTQSLANVWVVRTPRMDQQPGALVIGETGGVETLYSAWGPGRSWNIHSLDIASGKPGWVYGMASEPDYFGVTLSRSGILLTYTRPNVLRGLRAKDGMPIWTAYEESQIGLAPIDEQRQTVYSMLLNESLACRDLKTGALRWRYSWSDTLSEAQRESLMQRSGLRQYTRQPLEIENTGVCVGDDGIYIGLQTGEVIHLSPEGSVLWKVRLDAEAVSMVLFDNALLAIQQYQIPDVQDAHGKGPPQPDPADPFSLVKPNWGNLKPSKNVRHARFSRAVALSRSNGAILSGVDTAVTSLSNLCPAGGNIVFGGSRRGGPMQSGKHYITAYNWVEQ
jgi:outer membrane protein assembly factor BamB